MVKGPGEKYLIGQHFHFFLSTFTCIKALVPCYTVRVRMLVRNEEANVTATQGQLEDRH